MLSSFQRMIHIETSSNPNMVAKYIALFSSREILGSLQSC